MEDITIVILAGGESLRMGEDKGLMTLNGKPMIKHLIDTINPLNLKTIIISNNDKYKSFGIPVYKDKYKKIGPLGGIHSGFANTKTSRIFILSCDTPFVKNDIIKYLIEKSKSYDITVPKHGNQTHPLIGVYHRKIIKSLIKLIKLKKFKTIDLLTKNKSYVINVTNTHSADIFENINEYKDLYAEVRIKSFGMIAEQMKKFDIMVSIPNKERINLKKYFNKKWPFLNKISYTIAIDQELREELNRNEKPKEISILPPFAGG